MDWSQLLVVLLPLLLQQFGPLVQKLIDKLLPHSGIIPDSALVSPDAMKGFLKAQLEGAVTARLADNPVLKKLTLAVVSRLDGPLLDMLWAKLFQANLVAAMPAKAVPASAACEPIDVPPETDGAIKLEFGNWNG